MMEKMVGVWTVISFLAILHSVTCMSNSLAMDGCIVYSDFTFETVKDTVGIYVSHMDRSRHPSVRVKYNRGSEDEIHLNTLPFGKWTEGVLKLGPKSDFKPVDQANISESDAGAVKSEVKLRDGLWYRNQTCFKKTPVFVPDFNLYQLPRTGHTTEEVVLLSPLPSNVTLVVARVDLVICKVDGKPVVAKVTDAKCSAFGSNDNEVKLSLNFSVNKVIKLSVGDQPPISVNLTGDNENIKFKQDVTKARPVYVQCAGTCPDPDDGPSCASSNTAYTVVSVFLAIFVIVTVALLITVFVLLYKARQQTGAQSRPTGPGPEASPLAS